MDDLAKEFPTLTRPPEMSFRRTDIDPPSPLYVDRDDTLVLTIATFTTLDTPPYVVIRMLRPNGEIIPSLHAFPTIYNGLPQAAAHQLGEGFLLSCAVVKPTQASFLTEDVWVAVEITRGSFAQSLYSRKLVGGYLGFANRLAWPESPVIDPLSGPGNVRLVVGTNPAAGAEISATMPLAVRRKLMAIRFRLVTSVAVANRRVTLLLNDDSGNTFYRVHSQVTQTAAQTVDYHFAPGVPFFNADGIAGGPLPNELFVKTGYAIATSTFALDAGDDFTAPNMLFQEWLDI